MLAIAPFLAALLIDAVPGPAPVSTLALGGGVTVTEDGRVEPPSYEVKVNGTHVGGWIGEGWDASHALKGYRHGDVVLVASRVSQSNGIGIEHWSYAAVKLRGAGKIDPPVRWCGADWGGDGVRPAGATLEVLATAWLPADARGSLRFGGAWFQVEAGRLRAVGPWRTRRYLFSFERVRGKHWGEPAHWLRDARTLVLPARDPWRSAGDVRFARPITAVAWTTSGARVTLRGQPPTRIGTVSDGRTLWPDGYRPADDGRSWIGRRGVINGLGDRRVLTLAP